MSEKIQKILAREGLASRRAIEQWIQEGRIMVNGKKAKLGDRAQLKDKIYLDGQFISIMAHQTTRVLLYNKPEGEVVTRADEKGRHNVFENLPILKSGRWIAIGRLDINTSGLLLLTNEGELANRLMHPATNIEREYAVRVLGKVSAEVLQRLQQGVYLEDGFAQFHRIEKSGGEGANQWFHVIVKAGRNRLVRRLWESQGIKVNRLVRVRFAEIVLSHSIKQKSFVELNAEDVRYLKGLG